MTEPLILNDLRSEVFQLNFTQGWHADRDHSDECSLAMVALIHSEISEALEDVRNSLVALTFRTDKAIPDECAHDVAKQAAWWRTQKPCGLPSELADIVIRCLDFSSWFSIPLVEPTRPQLFSAKSNVRPRWAAAYLGKMHQVCGDEDISEVIRMCYCLAAQYGVDLDEVITMKHEYNKTRPAKHGGKTL